MRWRLNLYRSFLRPLSTCAAIAALLGRLLLFVPPASGASEPQAPEADPGEAAQPEITDEIVVTAEKRETRLSDVPLAVTAFTDDTLDELDLRTNFDLPGEILSFEVTSSFNNSKPALFLRGVGTNDFNANAAGTVGLFTDGVYITNQVFQTFDLERVEVLRGPQSALYGKNTIAGAVNYVSRKPSGETGGFVRVSLGRFDQVDLEGAVEAPLGGDRHAVRFSFVTNDRDGHTRNTFNGNDENDVDATAARALVRLVPSDNVTVLINVNGGINRSLARQFQGRGLLDGGNLLGYVESEDPFEGSYNFPSAEDVDLFGTSITVDWLGPGFALTAISAYQDADNLVRQDGDASPDRLIEYVRGDVVEQFSQELRLTSDSADHLTWIAGAYVLAEDLVVDNEFEFLFSLGPAGFTVFQDYSQETASWAVFGQVAYQVGDRLTFRGGLRHTWEEKDFVLETSQLNADGSSLPLIDFEGRLAENDFSGEIGLDYRPRAGMLIYGSVRRGFKSGGFNGGAFFPGEESVVAPEFLTSFEIGLKSSWLGDRLRFNASGFVYDYTDLQVFNVAAGTVPIQVLENASDARVDGLELELEARPRQSLRLSLGLGLLDTEYRDFVRRDGTDFSGNRLISAPEWSLNSAVTHSWELGGGLLTVSADYHYRAGSFFDPTSRPRIGTGGFGRVNGRLTFDLPGSRYTVGLWGKNLTDKLYLVNVIDVSGLFYDVLYYGDPVTYGVDFTLRF